MNNNMLLAAGGGGGAVAATSICPVDTCEAVACHFSRLPSRARAFIVS